MATLVTGGNGWLPSHIVRRLARRGEHVVSYDLMAPDDLMMEMLGDAAVNVSFVNGNVTNQFELQHVAREHKITKIIHAAVITPRREREQSEPARIVEVNLIGTINVLETARTIEHFERMVYVSSGAIWGSHPELTELNEETPSRATTLYGITKHTSERVCQRYAELFNLDIVSMRPANVFGPMERPSPGYLGATELREMLRIHFSGSPILINSLDGLHLDWTFVEDIAEGIERGWETPHLPHDVYAVTCGALHSVGDVLAAFKKHLPDLVYAVVPEQEANYLISPGPAGPVPSNARLQADFGWVPPTSFDDGMKIYLDWIVAHGPQ